tara:strand:- start:1691 stop:2374 length:684 start_codon:yes stop_codon:yes gene_type:complete
MSYGKTFPLLKEKHKKNWDRYTRHDFVLKLANNSLEPIVFLNYLIQDYLFLIQFSKAWSLAILKSDHLNEMKVAANTVNGLMNFEMDLHINLCKSYGISETDLETSNEANENIAYTRYVLETGYSGDFLDLLAALLPCVLGYGEIGINNIDAKPNAIMYQKWIDTYSSKEYQEMCTVVSKLMDDAISVRLGDSFINSYKWIKINKIFNTATLLEVDFWNIFMKKNIN